MSPAQPRSACCLYHWPSTLIHAYLVSPIHVIHPLRPDTRTALDYRLAPETQFPGPLHDAVSGYFRLVDDLHIPPENIVLAGDSAGGGLVLALLLYLRDNKYPLPSSAILMSPWVGQFNSRYPKYCF